MATSGHFNPPSDPACPYEPRMTRAEAIALRDAGGLLENCVVVVTDGPTIGVPGNTSPTEIELNPVAPNDLGFSARVHTEFDNSAWEGLYDIDRGIIFKLTDDRNNVVSDIDDDAPTVHTQFPWGMYNIRDNVVNDCAFTAVELLSGNLTIADSVLVGTTFDFTGHTANATINLCDIQAAYVVFASTGSTGSLFRTKLRAGNAVAPVVAFRMTGTGSASLSDCIVQDNYTLEFVNPSSSATMGDTTFTNGGNPGTLHARFGAPCSVNDNTIIGPESGGVGSLHIDVQIGSTGSFGIGASTIIGGQIRKEAGCSATVNFTQCELTGSVVNFGPACAASQQFIEIRGRIYCQMHGPVAGASATQLLQFASTSLGIEIAADATAGVSITGGIFNGGNIEQFRTVGTVGIRLSNCKMSGFTTITDDGNTDPGVTVGLNRCEFTDADVNINDLAPKTGTGTIMQQSTIVGSTVNISGLAGTDFLSRLEMLGASLDNGGFPCDNVVLQSAMNKTFTADNENRIANVAFDNVV